MRSSPSKIRRREIEDQVILLRLFLHNRGTRGPLEPVRYNKFLFNKNYEKGIRRLRT